jgi:hypothetical protein
MQVLKQRMSLRCRNKQRRAKQQLSLLTESAACILAASVV